MRRCPSNSRRSPARRATRRHRAPPPRRPKPSRHADRQPARRARAPCDGVARAPARAPRRRRSAHPRRSRCASGEYRRLPVASPGQLRGCPPMSDSRRKPPGTQPPRRFRPRLHWELLICALSGHELVGTDAAELRDEHAIFAREDAAGTRWYRCLRCYRWLALDRPAQPAREEPPPRDQIELPLRGKPLRDKVVLRVISVTRAFHFVVLVGLGLLVLVFAADRQTLRHSFYKALVDLQGGVAASQTHTHGLWHDLNEAFTTASSHLRLA